MDLSKLAKACTVNTTQSRNYESREAKLAFALFNLLGKFEINGLDKADPDITFFGSIEDLREAQNALTGNTK